MRRFDGDRRGERYEAMVSARPVGGDAYRSSPDVRSTALAGQIGSAVADAVAAVQGGHLGGDPLGDVRRGGELPSRRAVDAESDADQQCDQSNCAQ
jgi:hypothetical protein